MWRVQVLVMWGNVLYEQSQVRAQQSLEWEGLLETAVAKFREAKCSEEDIAGALLSHAGNKAKVCAPTYHTCTMSSVLCGRDAFMH
jgi:hypothetical protein